MHDGFHWHYEKFLLDLFLDEALLTLSIFLSRCFYVLEVRPVLLGTAWLVALLYDIK